MKKSIIHFGDITGWQRFECKDSFCIHQANFTVSNDIVFIPYLLTDTLSFNNTVAIFKIKNLKST